MSSAMDTSAAEPAPSRTPYAGEKRKVETQPVENKRQRQDGSSPFDAPVFVEEPTRPATAEVVVSNNSKFIYKRAPLFTCDALLAGSFGRVSLSELTAQDKWVVLFFYPLDFTFVCPTEILAFADRVKELSDRNAAVLFVSVDSRYTHLAWSQTPREKGGLGTTPQNPLPFPLLADVSHSISRDYNVLDVSSGHSMRGFFVIDNNGYIRHASVNDPPVGRSVDEAVRLLTAFQYADQYGQVCPVNWMPGDKTITPNVADSKAYFASVHP